MAQQTMGSCGVSNLLQRLSKRVRCLDWRLAGGPHAHEGGRDAVERQVGQGCSEALGKVTLPYGLWANSQHVLASARSSVGRLEQLIGPRVNRISHHDNLDW